MKKSSANSNTQDLWAKIFGRLTVVMVVGVVRLDNMTSLPSVVEKHYEGINRGDMDVAVEGFAPGVATSAPGMGTVRGVEPFKAFGQAFATAFPDGQIVADSVVEAGGTIVVEGHYTGTHTGPMMSPQGDSPHRPSDEQGLLRRLSDH